MATEPWAILCRHALDPLIPEQSVNPCLVVGARSAALDGEPAVQESKRRILLRFTAADIGQSGEVDKGARDSEQALG